MIIENSKAIIELRIKLFVVTVLVIVYLILTYSAKLIKFPLLGLSDSWWTFFIVFFYLCYLIYPTVLNYYYIYFSDEDDKIIIRYFIAGIISGRKNSIEIPKIQFSGFRHEKKLFGLVQSVTLFQNVRGGIAKYPPVYISLLTRKERSRLLQSLYHHAPSGTKEVNK